MNSIDATVPAIHGPSADDQVTEPVLKAAFIYNFAKFTEWPVDVMPAGESLLFCVLGDLAVGKPWYERSRAARWPATRVLRTPHRR